VDTAVKRLVANALGMRNHMAFDFSIRPGLAPELLLHGFAVAHYPPRMAFHQPCGTRSPLAEFTKSVQSLAKLFR
jgi:hypothetical protein